MAGAAYLGLMVILALLGPSIAPADPTLQNLADRRAPPGGAYLLGADEFGRDILSRLLYGTQVALRVAAVSVGAAMVVGTALGMWSAYYGGWIDFVISRFTDLLLAFPYLLLAIAVVSALGPGELTAEFAVTVWSVPFFARLARGSIAALLHAEFVSAARAVGVRERSILVRHMLPNIMSPIVVFGALFVARAILLESSLSFLGLGIQPPAASWGNMMSSGRDFLTIAPHIATIPGLAITMTVLSANLAADGLRDALDPRMKDL